MTQPVIVTRPARPGERLTSRLRELGWEAIWWPAFDIGPAPDVAAVRERLRRLAEYDLALFVSAHAVQATGELLGDDWPTTTVIGAVGAATRDAAVVQLRGARRATIVAPNVDDETGSEAFWRAWREARRHARRVLVLRAETGREWLADQLRAAGAIVDPLAVYRRRPHVLGAEELAMLGRWLKSGSVPLAVVTSSEAVETLLDQVGSVDGAAAWLQGGIAVATHPRVAQRLHSAGFRQIEACESDDDAIVRKLESIADRAAGSH